MGDAISLDLDALRLQSLIICERILGVQHKDMIYRLMYRGAAYADSLQYQHCIDLWKYALELRISKDTILYCDTCFTAQALVKLFLDLNEKHAAGVLSTAVCTEDVIHAIELLLSDLGRCSALLEIAPVYKRQQESWDKVLKIISHLLFPVTQLTRAPVLELPLRKKIHRLVHVMDPRTTQGDSLLHLAVSKSNSLESTPLHTASVLANFKQEVVELLLGNGGHIDMKNVQGVRPAQLLADNPASTVSITRFLSLKCLCAQVIASNKLQFKGEVPEVLETF